MKGNFLHKLMLFFADKRVGFVVIALAILSRTLQLLFFFNSRNDMSYQILAAQNFFAGHGISSSTILASDLSTTIYEPLYKWPPGFSILFTPFYALWNGNYLAAAITISILSGIVLLFVCRRILKDLNVPPGLINIYTLGISFFIYSFYTKPCTDATAITFFVIGIHYTLQVLKSARSWIPKAIAIVVSLFLCASIKYLYIPVVFAIPLFLILKGFATGNATHKKAGLIVLLSLVLVLGSLLLYQKNASGSVAYIKEQERGLFPENLTALYPFLPAAFLKPESILQTLPVTPRESVLIFRLFQAMHLTFFFFLSAIAIRRWNKTRLQSSDQKDNLFYLSVFLAIAITGLLITLSVTVAKELVKDSVFWTYVEEPRYYGLLAVLLQLGLVLAIQYYDQLRRATRISLLIILLLSSLEIMRGIIFTTHRMLYFEKEQYGWQLEAEFQKQTATVLGKEISKYPGVTIVLAGSSDWSTIRAGLHTGIPIFEDVKKLNNIAGLHTAKPVLIFFILRNDGLTRYKPFLTSGNTHYISSYKEFSYYTYLLNPR